MINAFHGYQTIAQGIHGIVAKSYASAAERLADGPYDDGYLYKVAFQEDTSELWILTNVVAPTWTLLTSLADGCSTIQVKKSTTGSINPNQLVYIAGYDSLNSQILVELAQSDSLTTMPTIGVAIETVTDSIPGKIVINGVVNGIDTSLRSINEVAFVSAVVAEDVTYSEPNSPNYTQQVWRVVDVGVSGSVYVSLSVILNGTVPAHADRHEYGGGDQIDGYDIYLNYAPSNYTPPENNIIGEHIASIDLALATAGTGDIVGPSSATDSAIALFDGITGKIIKNSTLVVDSDGYINGVDLENHASRHEFGGDDQIDGYNLFFEYISINFPQPINNIFGEYIASIDNKLDNISHSNLLDLDNDDHLQYLLINGTRPMAGNLDMDGYYIYHLDNISFEIQEGATVPYQEGRIYYDSVERALTVMNDISEARLQLGYENYIRVANWSGDTIPNGKVVYFNGVQGNRPTIALLAANNHSGCAVVAGITTHDIADHAEGLVTTFGVVRDINTTGFGDGVPLYVHPTNPGELTTTPPVDGYCVTLVGISLNTTTVGSILVSIKSPRSIAELDDVADGYPYDGYHLIGNGSEWTGSAFLNDVFSAIGAVTQDPSGFPIPGGNGTSVISKSDLTQTFTITPNPSFDVWVKGIKYTYTTPQTTTWTDVEGIHLFYFDTSGVLQTAAPGTDIGPIIVGNGATVAYVYWNATDNVSIMFCEERHGLQMDGYTHAYLHNTVGARYGAGGALSGFVINGTGNLDTNAQFAVENTVIWDEDLKLLSAVSGQVLTLPAQIPIFYRLGSDGHWRKKTANTFPIIYSGTAGYVGVNGLLPYNEWTGTVWQLSELGNNQYVLVHYYATGDVVEPIIGIQGQNSYGSVLDARVGAEEELANLAGVIRLLAKEEAPLGTVIFQTSLGYSNTPKAWIRSTSDGSDYIDFRNVQLVGSGNTFITTFSDGLFRIYDNVDTTKQLAFELSGITTGTLRTVTVPDRNVTLGTDDYAIHDNVAAEISVISEKTTPIAADLLLIEGSADTFNKKKLSIGNIPAKLTISAGTNTINTGTLNFSNSNGVSFGMNPAGVLTASTTQTSQVPNWIAAEANSRSSGTVSFSNSNGISFGMDTAGVITASTTQASQVPIWISAGTNSLSSGTITIESASNNVSAGMNTAGLLTFSVAPPISISAGTGSNSAGSFIFSNSNGVSFGMATGAASNTITASVASQVPIWISAGTNSTSSGTVVFNSTANGVSVGMDANGSITFSTTQASLWASAGTTRISSGNLAFSNSNNVTFGMVTDTNGGTITASINAAAAQIPLWVAAGTNSTSTGTISFSNSNGISFGMDTAGVITASMSAVAGDTLAISAGSFSRNSGTIIFNSTSNGVSVGMNSDGIITFSTSQTPIWIGAGTNSTSNGTVSFSNSNGVSFGMDTDGVVTASTTQASQVPIWISAGTNSTSSGTVIFNSTANGVSVGMDTDGVITFSTSSNTPVPLWISAGTNIRSSGSVTFSNSNNVSFGMDAAGVVTASVVSVPTQVPLWISAGTNSTSSGTVVFNSTANGVSVGMDTDGIITLSTAITSLPFTISAGTNTRSSGTVQFASNSQNVSAGMDTAGLITFSVAPPDGGIYFSAGTNSRSAGTVTFSNSNGVSFGMDTDGVVTASTTQASQVPIWISAGTNSTSSGTVQFASNSQNVSAGMDTNGLITFSVAPPDGGIYFSAGTNSRSAGTVTFSNSNGISFGMDTDGVVTASTTQASQVPIWISAGTNSTSSGTVVFNSTANGVSVGMDTDGVITFSTSSNTPVPLWVSAGTNIRSSGSITFSNSNNVSFGMDAAGIVTASVVSVPAQVPLWISAGTNSTSSGTVVFNSTANGISVGMDTNGSITLSTAITSLPFTISAGTNTRSSGTIQIASNSQNVSVGMDTNGLITLSVASPDGGIYLSAGTNSRSAGIVTFSNSNGISFGMDINGAVTASTTQASQIPIWISAGTNSRSTGTVVFNSTANGVSVGMDTNGVITFSTSSNTPTPLWVSAGTNIRSSGSVTFSNSNGVSFGMDTAGIITASVVAPDSGIAISAGTNLRSIGTVSFSNSNNVSFGMDTNGVLTASVVSVPAQVPIWISAGTNSTSSGTVVFNSTANGISVGMDTNGSVTLSTAITSLPFTISAGTNTRSSGVVQIASNSQNVSAGMDTNGLITFSVAPPDGGIYFSAGTNSRSAGTITFSNSNGISFGMDVAGVVTASTTQASQVPIWISAGTNSRSTGTIQFASNSQNISAGMDTVGLITFSVAPPDGGIYFSAGTNSRSVGTVTFSNSNGISFGMNTNGVVTASTTQASQIPIWISVGTNSRSTGTVQIASNSQNVSAGMDTNGLITLSVASQIPIWVSAGTNSTSSGTIQFSNSNNVSFGMGINGIITATAGAANGIAISAGTNSRNTGTVIFSNSNGVSFGMDIAGAITASVVAGGGVAISAGTNSRNTGTVVFNSTANGISCGMDTNGSVTWSVPITTFGNPADLGTASSQGTSAAAARADHVHKLVVLKQVLSAPDFDDPGTDWSVTVPASLNADTVNAAILVRRFDATTQEGVGWTSYIPEAATNVRFQFMSKAQTAPGATNTVGLAIKYREIPDNAALGAWSTYTLTDISIPTNVHFQRDSQTISLSTLSLTANRIYQFELVRQDPSAGTELAADWALAVLVIEWS